MGTLCPPPAAPRQSVIFVHKKTWAAPAGRQHSPYWPACAHRDPTWLHPMNRAPVLKSHTAGKTGLNQTRRKEIQKHWRWIGHSSSTPPLTQVEVSNSFIEIFLQLPLLVMRWGFGAVVSECYSLEDCVLNEEGAVSPRGSTLMWRLRSCNEAQGTRGGRGRAPRLSQHCNISLENTGQKRQKEQWAQHAWKEKNNLNYKINSILSCQTHYISAHLL